jgi:NSS family neurotransmitter:Na+ symporter
MPAFLLLVISMSIFSLTIKFTAADGSVRTGLQGLKIYLVPSVAGMSFSSFLGVILDASGQLFFSLSVAMGIMIAYGSYVSDDANLVKSINQIEIFDTLVAFLAGVMIIPAVYAFAGTEGMEASGPSLMFITLPKVFTDMGFVGNIIGLLFFAMVFFAALTSGVSIYEAIVSSVMDQFNASRKKSTVFVGLYALIFGAAVCLGYNKLYFEVKLPTGSTGQILDILDYISNNILMPVGAIGTCILVGWILKPKTVIDEVTKNGEKFSRKYLFIALIKFVVPAILLILLFKSLGFFS